MDFSYLSVFVCLGAGMGVRVRRRTSAMLWKIKASLKDIFKNHLF